MRSSILAVAGSLLARVACREFYMHQTPGFNLVLHSDNTTINGSTLSPCHRGAALEALCVESTMDPQYRNPSRDIFYLNSSMSHPDPDYGIITWILHADPDDLSSPMVLRHGIWSNVAPAELLPQNTGEFVGFDENEMMYILGPDMEIMDHQDGFRPWVPLYRWYSCITSADTHGYIYETLAWVIGATTPSNPTCKKVDVQRVFV